MAGEASRSLYEKALNLFPGGVNSPVRAAVKPYPFYVERAEGPYLYTVDGARLIDLVLAYGPLILGHRHPKVMEALERQIERGWLYGTPSELEVRLAEKILGYVKPGGKIRFVNSGTEATMTAIRLARGVTGRKIVVKFDGCYHGAHDTVLVGAGSAATEYGVPSSAGVPEEVARLTLVVPYNDVEAVEKVMARHGDETAAIIVEPVAANMGVVPPRKGFLQALRRLADEHGALLIFDEVVTGFRLSMGGAQDYYGVRADIVTLGKVIGGGLPIGAVVADAKIMDNLTPVGKVFNAGTFNAHPLAMAAGLATLEAIEAENALARASKAAKAFHEIMEDELSRKGVEHVINRVESMMQVFFTRGSVENAEQARASRKELYAGLHEELLRRGVFIAPSQFEAIFFASVHDDTAVLDSLAEAVKAAAGRLGA